MFSCGNGSSWYVALIVVGVVIEAAVAVPVRIGLCFCCGGASGATAAAIAVGPAAFALGCALLLL